MKKRIVSVICILMIVFSFSLNTFAAETPTVKGRYYLNKTLTVSTFFTANTTFYMPSSSTQYSGIRISGSLSNPQISVTYTSNGSTYTTTIYSNGAYVSNYASRIIDFGSTEKTVSQSLYNFLKENSVWLDDPNFGKSEIVVEQVYIKENRPLFDIPLSDYSVNEGILLLIFVVVVLNNVFKSHIRG